MSPEAPRNARGEHEQLEVARAVHVRVIRSPPLWPSGRRGRFGKRHASDSSPFGATADALVGGMRRVALVSDASWTSAVSWDADENG